MKNFGSGSSIFLKQSFPRYMDCWNSMVLEKKSIFSDQDGATSVLEPELEPWGQRTCYIADPEGNLIEIGSWNKPYEEKDLTEG